MSAAARGVVLRAEDAQLVIAASPEQVAQFARGAHVSAAALSGGRQGWLSSAEQLIADGMLYDAGGRPVAHVTSVKVESTNVDVTSHGDAEPVFIAGLPRTTLTAVLL